MQYLSCRSIDQGVVVHVVEEGEHRDFEEGGHFFASVVLSSDMNPRLPTGAMECESERKQATVYHVEGWHNRLSAIVGKYH